MKHVGMGTPMEILGYVQVMAAGLDLATDQLGDLVHRTTISIDGRCVI